MQSVNSSVAYPLDTSCKTAENLRACWRVWQQGKRKELAFGWPTHSPSKFWKPCNISISFWLLNLIFFRAGWAGSSDFFRPPLTFGNFEAYPSPFGPWDLNCLMAGWPTPPPNFGNLEHIHLLLAPEIFGRIGARAGAGLAGDRSKFFPKRRWIRKHIPLSGRTVYSFKL